MIASHPSTIVLEGCTGRGDQTNDVIFTGCPGKPSLNIVYFGGDVQDLSRAMKVHAEGLKFIHWNLEQTGRLLFDRFSACSTLSNPHVWIIRPSHYVHKVFACYSYFLPFDSHGIPLFDGVGKNIVALDHLTQVLSSAVSKLKEQNDKLQPSFLCAPLYLIGFSKGCCVLTTIFYELSTCAGVSSDKFHSCQLSSPLLSVLQRLCRMYWLDGGHSGGEHQWPIFEKHLSAIDTEHCPEIFVYATPYQVMDTERPWKAREFYLFLGLLKKYNLPHRHDILFGDQKKSDLESHFNILKSFPIE
ncbi:unnamed protein product [Calicophoron daubneyi]